MKTIAIVLLAFALFSSCSKKNYSREEKQETLNHEESPTPEALYVFDIDSFKYLDEFPRSIAGIKALYPDEDFKERVSENTGKGPLGEYIYSLTSSNIQFIFWGDSIDEANLLVVEIFNAEYQCRTIKVIGMSAEELEHLSGKKLTRDKTIVISTELYVLTFETKEGVVQNYFIIAQL